MLPLAKVIKLVRKHGCYRPVAASSLVYRDGGHSKAGQNLLDVRKITEVEHEFG